METMTGPKAEHPPSRQDQERYHGFYNRKARVSLIGKATYLAISWYARYQVLFFSFHVCVTENLYSRHSSQPAAPPQRQQNKPHVPHPYAHLTDYPHPSNPPTFRQHPLTNQSQPTPRRTRPMAHNHHPRQRAPPTTPSSSSSQPPPAPSATACTTPGSPQTST